MTIAPVEKHSGTAAEERRAIGSLRLLAALSLLFPVTFFVIASILSYRTHFDDAHQRLSRAADLIQEHALKVFDSLSLTASEVDEIIRGMSDDDIRRDEAALHARLDAINQALLLTDVGLPEGMNGRQLADEIQYRCPGLKVLFMTGYARNAIIHHGHIDPGVQFLPKPFTRDALARKILDMFGRQSAI